MREMKDSGIEWIGEIPRTWNLRRLRFLCEITTGNMDTQDNNPEGQYPFYVRSPIIERSDKYTFDNEAILMAGDGVGAGKVFHYIKGKYGCHQRVYSMSAFKDIIAKYLYYYMSENFYKKIEESNAKSTVDSVRLPMLKDFYVAFPDLKYQYRIVDYLDKKCSKVDTVIEKQQEIIEKLKEYKLSVITEAVTKGLNSDVEMEDSGIEWIGKIPSKWIIEKLKFLLKSPLQYGASESGIEYSPNLPRYIRITDITPDGKLKEEGKLSLTTKQARGYILEDKDILFARSGASVGKSFIYNVDYGESAFAGYLIKASIDQSKAVPEFVYYHTIGIHYEIWKNAIFNQATIQNIGADKYSNLVVTIPDTLNEQEEIVSFLNKKCSQIDKEIEKREVLVDKIAEYKKSLIYEVVTGKKEV